MPQAPDLKQVWENALVEVGLVVSRASFTTWFRGTHITKLDEETLYVGVPSLFYRDWLSSKYHKIILRAVRSQLPEVRSVEYVVAQKRQDKKPKRRLESPVLAELPLNEHQITRADNLNPRYTFDSFVVGPFNEVAFAATQAVLNQPGLTYNPLFIYGNTGYGKTHLIQAAGNRLKKLNPSRKIFYVSSEKFGNDFVSALQTGTIEQYKARYRGHDVLIMDDVQFLSGRDKTQDELFHLFNTLYESNKQIIFSSDRHPNYIQNLADRLKSRFSQGMIVDISIPDYESRLAILKAKAANANFALTDELAYAIAGKVQGNIRDLEGALNRVVIETQLRGRIMRPEDLHTILEATVKPQRAITIQDLVRRVAEYYNVEEGVMYQKSRKKEVVRPRQIIMYLMREDLNISFPTIGEKLGGRDHSTVIHSCEKIRRDVEVDPDLKREIEEIRAVLR